ncbi:alpha/beta fold hydrolase [Agromyces sp. MMS24-JH15]|uniref:alpha/beta fold hydrolase n=1 Tax=Agromyces sp. MMS24-JH15 TaxID=3243765 RepID=UPI00374827FE
MGLFSHERGSGTPLVLLHGFGVDHRILLPLDPAIERAGGWRRIFLDLPGATGSPDAAIRSTRQVAEATLAEVRERVGSEPFAILGNSYGGLIARYVAHELRSQVLGLATLAGVFVADHDARDLPPRAVLHVDDRVIPILGDELDGYRDLAVHESPEGALAHLEFVAPGLHGADQAALDRISADYDLPRAPEDVHPAAFLQPSLHLTARQDHVVGYRDAWARLEHYPRATFVALDGAGHNAHLERPDLVAALVADWLARIRTGIEDGGAARVIGTVSAT